MKIKFSKALSLVLALMMIVLLIPMGVVPAEASGLTLAQLQAKFPNGWYWNHYVSTWEEAGDYLGVVWNEAYADSVSQTRCNSHATGLSYSDYVGHYDCNFFDGAWQCQGFARKLAYDAYGSRITDWGIGSIYSIKPGDVVHFKMSGVTDDYWGHWVMVIAVSGTTVTVGECNVDYDNCRIRWNHTYNLANAYACTVYSAPYTLDTNVPSYTYTSITPGTYYLKNKATGKYLIVDSGLDVNEQNISVWPFADVNEMKYEITATTTGYKMRPLCSSSRVVNAYGYTPGHGSNVNLFNDVNDNTEWWQFEVADGGGYYIHNVYAPNCVLDTDGYNALIANKHGGASQIWYLEPVVHDCNKGEYMYFWEAHPHYNCYKCSICGTIWEDKTVENYIESCEECNIVYPYPVPGDVTGDYQVNLADVTLILKYIANWDVTLDFSTADVTADNNVNLADVTLILKYIANWDVTFKNI